MLTSRLRELLQGRSFRAQLLRDGAGSLAVKGANVALMFAVTVLLARVLGPGSYGLYAFAFAVATLLTIPAQAGMLQLAVRETAKALNNQDWPRLKGLWMWSARNVALVAGGLVGTVGAGLWLAAPWVEGPRLVTVTVSLGLVPVLALTRVWGATLRGLGRVVIGQVPDLILRPAVLIASVGAWTVAGASATLTAPIAMGLHAAATCGAMALGGYLLWRSAPPGVSQAEADWQAVPYWWRAAIPFVFLGGLHLINNQADILMLGLLRADQEVGVYRVVVQISMLVVFGLSAVNQVIQPHFARLYEQGDRQRMQILATRTSRAVAGFALIPVTLFVTLGSPLLVTVFGAEYNAGATPLAVLALGQLFNAAMGSAGMILSMTGHERDAMGALGVAAVANIGLNLLLIPSHGATGAALATAVTLVIWNSVLVWIVYRRIGVVSAALRFREFSIK